jgi:hypothetical protein
MIRGRLRMGVIGLLALECLPAACHGQGSRAKKDRSTPVVVRDTALVNAFKDTAVSSFAPPGARRFSLPAQRDSLLALLKRERKQWRARNPQDYRFLLRVGCFCPGPRGWLLMDVRSGQPLRAWDRTGKAVALEDWNTFNIDRLFDNVERSAGQSRAMQIVFDPRWHFPSYVYTSAQMPDTWGIIEARGFRKP